MIRSSLARRITKLNRSLKADVQRVDKLGRLFTTSSADGRDKDATKKPAAAVQPKSVATGAVPIAARKKGHARDQKKRLKRSSPNDRQVCAAYSTNGDVDLKQLHLTLTLKGMALEGLEKYGNESSGCSIPGATGRENGYLFMFPSGSLVFWDVPLGTRRKIFDEASGLSGNDPIVPFNEFDHEFEITANESTYFKNDKIHVKDLSNKEELLALSFGLAQSTKLQVYEEAIDKLVEETQVLPNQLAIHGRIYESNRTLKQRMGTLLSARYSVSLLSDILDTPDFFWEHPNLEVLHKQCRSEIGMSKRVNLLSRRMDIIKDSLDLINTEISDTSSRRVEWYIVSLIAVEIAIEVGKLFFDR